MLTISSLPYILADAKHKEIVKTAVSQAGYGQHDANWLAFYDFARKVGGYVKETEKCEGLWLIAEAGGWFLPYETICFIADRPSILARDENQRLHNLNGPALQFRDGWE